ncbi:MAG: class II aldolase/adducin family protein, partial [Congregibacter sp.]|nr:class II aldolase/adducin family protein [Congregibacter sp.]
PYGLHYSEVTASNLIKVDIEGNIIDATVYPVNPAGMLIHSAIHRARPDVHCISHLHTDAGMAVACQRDGLRSDNFYSVLLHDQVAYHDFEGLTVEPEEKQRLVANLGDKKQLILRNHGLLSCGFTIPEMFLNTWLLQRACEVQLAADVSAKPVLAIADAIAAKSAQLLKIQRGGAAVGELEFKALLRRIDKIDSSFRN